MDVSAVQILIVLVIALLVFGPKRLPELGRQVGRGMREMKRQMNEVTSDLTSVREEVALLIGLLACIAAIGVQAASSAPAGWLQVVLGMQALPYAAAIFCAWLSRAEQRR